MEWHFICVPISIMALQRSFNVFKDGLVPSGEGFVRQFLYGQRYFEKEFGRRCTEVGFGNDVYVRYMCSPSGLIPFFQDSTLEFKYLFSFGYQIRLVTPGSCLRL